MQDVTAVLDGYRECVRHLWNIQFRADDNAPPSAEIQDYFEEITYRLFEVLVLIKLGRRGGRLRVGYDPFPFLRVTPLPGVTVPIMIERPRPGDRNHYWDDPVNRVNAAEVELSFIGYFDWEPYGVMDCRYYHVRITAFATQPHLVGRDALVETTYGRVELAGE